MANPKSPQRIPARAALEVLAGLRKQQIVVTSMGSSREWPAVSQHPLDFHYLPSSMGQAPAIALGLALARPDCDVWCLCGDGSLLMNLGCLVTIAASGATNLTLIVLDNGVYEVTGGQKTAGSIGRADFPVIAHGCGLRSIMQFDELSAWKEHAETVLTMPGPRFVSLAVEPVRENFELATPAPMTQRLAAFREALAAHRVAEA